MWGWLQWVPRPASWNPWLFGRMMGRRPHKMQCEAFLVATIDTTKIPYEVVGADIYSESALSLTLISKGYCNVDVFSVIGDNYADAKKKLIDNIVHDSYFKWVVDVLPETTQREIAIKDIIE